MPDDDPRNGLLGIQQLADAGETAPTSWADVAGQAYPAADLYRDPTLRSAVESLQGSSSPWTDALAQAYQGVVNLTQRQQQDQDQLTGKYLKWGHAPDTWEQRTPRADPSADPTMQTQPSWVPGTSDQPTPPLILNVRDEDRTT